MLGKDIKNLVTVKLDEYTPYGPAKATLLAGGDQLNEVKPVYSYTDQTLAEAANEMLMIAPINRLIYRSVDAQCTPDEDDARIGTIELPRDFLRLHTLRMKGWVMPVHEAYNEGSEMDGFQQRFWSRGTKEKPVAILSGLGENNSINKELRYYSVSEKEAPEVRVLRYIPCFEETMEYDRSIAELIALNCARKVFQSYGQTEQISIMTQEINSVLATMRE